ncbi:hypothetical protein MT356_17200 [Rathayibacter festucae]|uniref:hypothetical protein n=1 Tax=Rathayibacter festucae TaxID=110937 RepID=UPI001FB1ABDE|nr:hypothetical protein [Rathayibacter festucae]MCJ1701448.1 hypothetical protein [Rathayibacter festucae]
MNIDTVTSNTRQQATTGVSAWDDGDGRSRAPGCSGPVVDSFASSSLQCAATAGAGETTQAAFEHLRTSIRPVHPGESLAFNGLTAPACR